MQDLEASQEQRNDVVAEIGPGNIFEQRLETRFAGTSNIDFWVQALEDDSISGGSLAVEVYTITAGDEPLVSWRFGREGLLDYGQIGVPIPKTVAMPPGGYTVRMYSTTGVYQIFGAQEDIYTTGGAFIDGSPVSGDASFVISYDYAWAGIREDLGRLGRQIVPIILALAVLLLPGWLVLRIFHLDRDFDLGENIALMLGTSLAVIPVVFTWTSLVGLRWNAPGTRILLFVIAALIAWSLYRARKQAPGNFRWSDQMPSLALLFVILATGLLRFVMIRNISAPPWVDSVHHALITRLILENGVYPETYAPFLNIDASAYHTGFHSVLAVFQWISGLDLPEGMLLFGQVLNTLMTAGVYLFTTSLTRDRLSGVAAALVAGTFSPMPAYYTSWGRYTQLAGLAILAAASALVLLSLRRRADHRGRFTLEEARKDRSVIVCASILSAGLYLTHLRVVAFYALLLVAVLIVRSFGEIEFRPGVWARLRIWLNERLEAVRSRWLPGVPSMQAARLSGQEPAEDEALPSPRDGDSAPHQSELEPEELPLAPESRATRLRWRPNFKYAPSEILIAATIAVLALLLVLPNIYPTIEHLILPKIRAWSSGEPAQPFDDFNWAFLTTGWGRQALGLAGAGLLLGVLGGGGYIATLLLWVAGMFALANLDALALPGSGLVNDLSVEISLFLPISLLAGSVARWIVAAWRQLTPAAFHKYVYVLLGAGGIVLGMLGARSLAPILNPVTFLYRDEDRAGIDWIAENIPPGETIAINPFAWGYGIYAGNDGGYWIGPLSGRPTMPPPVLYGLTNSIKYYVFVDQTSQAIIEHAADPNALYETLKAAEIDYLYLGARGGPIDAQAVRNSPLFETLFEQRGVYIFRAR